MQEAVKDQMYKMTNNMTQSASEINMIAHEAVSAMLQSASAVIRGFGDLNDTLSSLTQKSLEQAVLVSQTMMSATSVNDLVSSQNNIIKSNFDSMMSDMSNITQLSSRIAQQAAEPVTKHMNQAMSKMSKSSAA